MPLYSSDIEEIKKLSLIDIIAQAVITTFLLINEAEENGGKFVTKPIRNLTYKNKVLDVGVSNEIVPDKPTTLVIKEQKIKCFLLKRIELN